MLIMKMETCRPLRKTSTKIVGFHNHLLYLTPNENGIINIYCVNSLVPKEQYSIFNEKYDLEKIQEYSMTFNGEYIYCFTVGLFNDMWQPVIFKIKSTGDWYKIYLLNEESYNEFENVFINNIGIHCGENDAYLYDRTLAKGDIPFWKINLNNDNNTFDIIRNVIPDAPNEYICNRFPILGNPDNQQFMKTTDNEIILIYEDNEWIPYYPDKKNELNMETVSCRGVHESYGRVGQRFTAIETALSIFSNHNQFIFKLSIRSQHIFYILTLNKKNQTYILNKKLQVQQPNDTLFYRLINSNDRIALVARQSISFFIIKPLKLKELAFWKIQQFYGKNDLETKTWTDGITDDELKSKFQIKMKSLLI